MLTLKFLENVNRKRADDAQLTGCAVVACLVFGLSAASFLFPPLIVIWALVIAFLMVDFAGLCIAMAISAAKKEFQARRTSITVARQIEQGSQRDRQEALRRNAAAIEKARDEIAEMRRRVILYRCDNAHILDDAGRWSIGDLHAFFDRLTIEATNNPDKAMREARRIPVLLHDACLCTGLHQYRSGMNHCLPGFDESQLERLLLDISEPYQQGRITAAQAVDKYREIREMMQRMVNRHLPAFNAEKEASHLEHLAKALDDDHREEETLSPNFRIIRQEEGRERA